MHISALELTRRAAPRITGRADREGAALVHWSELAWYCKRLSRMSAAEIAHRLHEQWRREADRRADWSWAAFGHQTTLRPIPGLLRQAATSELRARAAIEAVEARNGRFTLLGTTWPRPMRGEWW